MVKFYNKKRNSSKQKALKQAIPVVQITELDERSLMRKEWMAEREEGVVD